MGAYEITAMVVFKSLWWIIPLLCGITALAVCEYMSDD